MKNVKEAANARAVLASYHPLWLRLGAEVVVGRPVAGAPPCCRGDAAPAAAAAVLCWHAPCNFRS